MNKEILLEVAIESVDDALAAQRGGADRLELCAALDLGGLTPSLGTVAQVARQAEIPVVVMIRPRCGGFAYSNAELATMEEDIDSVVQAGADGLVLGVLDSDGALDVGRMKRLVTKCGSLPAVCHRAFDFVPDPFRALEELIDLGVTRVLSAGQQSDVTAPTAMKMIHELQERAAGRIEILPGGGVREHNVAELIRRTGCTQVHGSFRTRCQDSSMQHRAAVSLGTRCADDAGAYGVTDEAAVKAVRLTINTLVE